VSKGDLTIEQLLEEKKTFDLSRDFEKLGLESEDDGKGWLKPGRSCPLISLYWIGPRDCICADHSIRSSRTCAEGVVATEQLQYPKRSGAYDAICGWRDACTIRHVC